MNEDALKALLAAHRSGELSEDDAVARLRQLPFADLGFARYDHHRALRRGFPEVIFGIGKKPDQLVGLIQHAAAHHPTVLATRITPTYAEHVQEALPDLDLEYHELARCLILGRDQVVPSGRGSVLVVCAGTSDLEVACEAAITAEVLGNTTQQLNDVGVAGLHRILAVRDELHSASVIIVVAGMEGALASVVAGLVDRPVIAVPTSIGYGSHMGGLAPLLSMLNSCSPGVVTVNIDNGFGAAYAASLMNRREPS